MDDLKWALAVLRERAGGYQLCLDYYYGRHRLAFATEKFRNAFGSLFRAFADNLCPAVVDAFANKTLVTGFDGSLATPAWQLWTDAKLAQRAGELHTEAFMSGDSYLVIWPDETGRPVFFPNRAELMRVRYDEERPGTITLAVKHWVQADKSIRLNLYYPDRIEKYVTSAKTGELPEAAQGLVPFEQPGEAWPLPNPYGAIPVFHFANNARLGEYGRSELADVIPLQDALNKAVADMLVAMEFVALPQRWATGLEVDLDEETGKPKKPFEMGADRIVTVGDPAVKFGQFDPANLAQFTQVQDSFRVEIARVKGLPLYFLALGTSVNQLSGEAMKVLEGRFTAAVRDRQSAFGDVWAQAMRLALQMSSRTAASGELFVQWQDPAPRNELEAVQILVQKKDIGVSKAQLQREAGYTEKQIADMKAENEADAVDAGDQFLTKFDQGA